MPALIFLLGESGGFTQSRLRRHGLEFCLFLRRMVCTMDVRKNGPQHERASERGFDPGFDFGSSDFLPSTSWYWPKQFAQYEAPDFLRRG